MHTPFMPNALTILPNSPPLRVRLEAGQGDAKEYVLFVTKQGGLLLNKVVVPKS